MDLVFQKGTDSVIIRVENKKITFSKLQGQYLMFSDIEGLKFSVGGILEEFPDLKDKENKEVIKIGKQRFKDHIKNLRNDKEVTEYLRKDLMKHGYVLKLIKRKGHRPTKC